MNPIINFLFSHTPLFYLTQSIWRDEAFSYFMAKPPLFQIIQNTAADFNPPLYYIVLHLWILIVDRSDIGLRMLSFVFHALTVYASYCFAVRLFSKRFAVFVAAFTFLNPMLLYYAFEIRMYTMYAFFTVLSFFLFYTKKWRLFTVCTVLGLYTHSFFLMVPASLVVYTIGTRTNRKASLEQLKRILLPFVFYIPWLLVLINQFRRSKDSWVYPVDTQLIRSSLGNLFTNFDGTPDAFWRLTALLSLVIIFFLILPIRKYRDKTLLFLAPFLPLATVLIFSAWRQPIFVNRYMIFITVCEIFGISLGIWSIRRKMTRYVAIGFWIILVVWINILMPQHKKKTDFRASFQEINALAKPEDTVYSETPIGFLESAYYFRYPAIFVYNPTHSKIPDYIGVNVVFPNVSRDVFPPAPSRTFLVHDDASYEVIEMENP